MDKKTYAIGVLSIVAAVLLVGNLMPLPQAQATTTIKDRDYTLTTTRGQTGGEALYVIDNSTGAIACISISAGVFKVLSQDSLVNLTPTR